MSERCLEGVWMVSEFSLKVVCKVSGKCLHGVCMVSGRCLDPIGVYSNLCMYGMADLATLSVLAFVTNTLQFLLQHLIFSSSTRPSSAMPCPATRAWSLPLVCRV